MDLKALENLMYYLSDFFLAPVLLLLVLLFVYSLFALGAFACQALQRRTSRQHYLGLVDSMDDLPTSTSLKGYPLAALVCSTKVATKEGTRTKGPGLLNPALLNKDRLDVAALRELEGVRTVSRLAPMLGLIATMIPMGPALKSLSDGNIQGISENLIVAFSAVIFGLVIASITFWIASIKKRWLATELVDLTPHLEQLDVSKQIQESPSSMEKKHEAA